MLLPRRFLSVALIASLLVSVPGPGLFEALAGEIGKGGHDAARLDAHGDDARKGPAEIVILDGAKRAGDLGLDIDAEALQDGGAKIPPTGGAPELRADPAGRAIVSPPKAASREPAPHDGILTYVEGIDGPGADAQKASNVLDTIYRESRSLRPDAQDILALPRMQAALENLRRTKVNGRYRYKAAARIEKAVHANLTPYFQNYAIVGLIPELDGSKNFRGKDAAIGVLGRLALRSNSIDEKKAVLQLIVDAAHAAKDQRGGRKYLDGWITTAKKIALSSDDQGLHGFAFKLFTRDVEGDQLLTGPFHDRLVDAAERVVQASPGMPLRAIDSVEPLALPDRVKATEPKGWFQDIRTRLPAGFVVHPVASILAAGITILSVSSLLDDSLMLAVLMAIGGVHLTAKALWTNHHIANLSQLLILGTILSQGPIETFYFGFPGITILVAAVSFVVARLSYRWHRPGLGLLLNTLILLPWLIVMQDLAALALELLSVPSFTVPHSAPKPPTFNI